MGKIFTLEEANRALALVRPIAADILGKMVLAERLHEEIKQERVYSLLDEQAHLEKLNAAEKLLNEIEYHLKELESVGAEMKDLKIGLVDFPCHYEGRLVHLCWMAGESEVRFWHEPNKGFHDRRALAKAVV